MEITVDISNNFPSLYTSKSDSSMFFCPSKQEEEMQEEDLNQHEQMMMINNQKHVKTTVSFPFGKW